MNLGALTEWRYHINKTIQVDNKIRAILYNLASVNLQRTLLYIIYLALYLMVDITYL